MANIVILGNGFVGQHLFKHLSKNNNFHVSILKRSDINYHDPILIKKFIREHTNLYIHHEDTIILNCAGFTGRPNVDQCEVEKELCLDLNTKLPIKLSYFCKKNNYWLLNVSSGCIFTGYEKEFTELDVPNFGIYNPQSSFYSKCKHLAEEFCDMTNTSIFRIRMPFCAYNNDRNYINKILNYSNLISFKNSMTCIEDFSDFIEKFITCNFYKTDPGIYNVVNPGAVDAQMVVNLLSKYNHINKNWKFVDIEDLDLKAGRSNCVLSDAKIADVGLNLPSSVDSLEECIKKL